MMRSKTKPIPIFGDRKTNRGEATSRLVLIMRAKENISTKIEMSIIIKNISISDVVSGQIIFQRVHSWKSASGFSNLGSLIQVFHQFAREVDDGGILHYSL
ncbi:hypothetical protein EON65_50130 [archaeon]|nr:MAG: hypothetical protein EON65_50130 [archaeon]